MTDSKLFWFLSGSVSALALIVLWSAIKGRGGSTRLEKNTLEDTQTFRKVKDLIEEADELLEILKVMDEIP